MKPPAILIGLVLLCAACSSSTPPEDEQPAPAGQGPKLRREQAQDLVAERLEGMESSTRTPSLRHDLPCIDMINVVIFDQAGQPVLSPDAIGFFKSLVNEDDGFYLEYRKPFEWEVIVDSLQELSPGVVEISYTARVSDPPHHIVLWFEVCASESGTAEIMVTEKGTVSAELSDDGEWKLL